MRFVHLKVHSEYSLVDSIVRIRPLVERTRSEAMPAVGLTDLGNVSAMVKFYRAALSRGIKPVVGAELFVSDSTDGSTPSRLTLLCMHADGFKNLSRLLTRSHAHGGALAGKPLALKEWLSREALEGLIGLSGGQSGELGRALAGSHPESAGRVLDAWCTLLPDRYYIELQRLGRPGETEYLGSAVELAAHRGLPVVATNDVCFLDRDDFSAHETRVCIAQSRLLNDPERPREHTEEQHFKSVSEMCDLFSDLPEAVANTLEISRRCSLELSLDRIYMPRFDEAAVRGARELLLERTEKGLAARLERAEIPAEDRPEYEDRMHDELDVICEMGFEGYFLIVADFVDWSRSHSIPVGPGRGSGAGSVVAWALGITNLDPIEHELLFERFLNPERVSMPDFDIDFCIEGRDRVIEYVSTRYGRDRVAQIITYGTMAARAVVRDVGRVLGMTYGYVDRIAKLIPFELGITLEKALEDDEELRGLYETEEEVRELIELAMQLEGLARNAGTHAGGVVIAPDSLTEFMPLFVTPESSALTQLDKDDLEALGLVKFDFLGLKTLTIIDKALQSINAIREEAGEQPIDLDGLPMDDKRTYALLDSCRTTAVFQLESRGMRDLIERLKPDCFEDLVAILALFRPGPLQSGMVDEFIERKHGQNNQPIDYLHPMLEPILKSTYGVILYQEQVMQIAQVMAGYSLGGADLLRRAMGKKKPEEMAKQRSTFEQGAAARGIDEPRARTIFDLMEKFAGYGFNKSHSAAYALIAYQTAWLKAHYPAAFMAAAMTADIDNTDKLVVLKEDCIAFGLSLEPPNVNTSELAFTVRDSATISYGLGAVKGVGRAVVEAIVSERARAGPFASIMELCDRVGAQRLNRRMLEALTRAGALDGLGVNRATLMRAVPDALQLAERIQHASAAGQGALFSDEDSSGGLALHVAEVREWSKRERLEAERESLGLYLTGHPFEDFAGHCRKFGVESIAAVLGSLPEEGVPFRFRREATLAGVVMDVRKRGNRVSMVLDDDTDRVEATVFEDVYAESRHLITKHAILVVRGQVRYDDFLKAWMITAESVQSVDDAIESHAKRLTIRIDGNAAGRELVNRLSETLRPFTRGSCEVCVQYQSRQASALLTLGDDWSVRATRELREELAQLVGEDRVSIHYPRHFAH